MDVRKNIALILLFSMVCLSSFSVFAQGEKQDLKNQVEELQKKLELANAQNMELVEKTLTLKEDVMFLQNETKKLTQLAEENRKEAYTSKLEADKLTLLALKSQKQAQENAEKARLAQIQAEKQAEETARNRAIAQENAIEARKQYELYLKCKEGK